MYSESDMENAIALAPDKYLNEKGLNLLARQYRIGNYIFDLLFQDRHGGKLIVEIQKGTLDREHTYKILDYYHEYKKNNPSEFVELIVVANKIPRERQERLKDWGVGFLEIPRDEFSSVKNTSNVESAKGVNVGIGPNLKHVSKDIQDYYVKFKEQKEKIINGLLTYDSKGKSLINWKELKPDNIETRTNWFFGFRPSYWGTYKGSGFGVSFWFYPFKGSNLFIEKIRMNIGVESPMKNEFKDSFKTDIAQQIIKTNLLPTAFDLYPDAGVRRGGVLLEARYDFSEQVYEEVLAGYKSLENIIGVVGDYKREYSNKGAFKVPVNF